MNSTRVDRNPATHSDDIQDIEARLKLRLPVVVDEIKRIQDKGALKGFATVTVNKFTIHGCRIIQAPGQSVWVSLPHYEVKQADGSKSKWYPIIEIHDKNLRRGIENAVLAAYAEAGP